jgi:hypothetical protein
MERMLDKVAGNAAIVWASRNPAIVLPSMCAIIVGAFAVASPDPWMVPGRDADGYQYAVSNCRSALATADRNCFVPVDLADRVSAVFRAEGWTVAVKPDHIQEERRRLTFSKPAGGAP